jgi:hypothetical protein
MTTPPGLGEPLSDEALRHRRAIAAFGRVPVVRAKINNGELRGLIARLDAAETDRDQFYEELVRRDGPGADSTLARAITAESNVAQWKEGTTYEHVVPTPPVPGEGLNTLRLLETVAALRDRAERAEGALLAARAVVEAADTLVEVWGSAPDGEVAFLHADPEWDRLTTTLDAYDAIAEHHHPEIVPGCHRCDIGRDEAGRASEPGSLGVDGLGG